MIGSIICFRVGDFLGRRRELLVAGLLFFFGAVVEAASGSSVWAGSWGLVVLMIGRVSYGIGCGFAMHGVRIHGAPSEREMIEREREREREKERGLP